MLLGNDCKSVPLTPVQPNNQCVGESETVGGDDLWGMKLLGVGLTASGSCPANSTGKAVGKVTPTGNVVTRCCQP